ncbi:hypothetical protein AB1Y20_011061 [Prymnesium parvum]|uniref:Uncharacterized protein n=1 Tax=Prymnesium parvum TaxID=97485 RepID=A0AB34IN05_PRYPA
MPQSASAAVSPHSLLLFLAASSPLSVRGGELRGDELPNSPIVVFSLVRGGPSESSYESLVNSRRCLRSAMPLELSPDDVVFHEGNVPPRIQRGLAEQIPRLRFVDARDHFGFRPEDEALVPDPPLDYPIGYRHMCQWMSMLWFRALRQYEYAIRVDEDVCITHLPASALLAALGANYAYGLVTSEAHQPTLATFLPWLRGYMARTGKQPTLPPLPTAEIYFTNFFISRVRWWEQPEVRAFLAAVNASGGVYRHRWGDAPIQTAALRLHAAASSVVGLAVDYVHLSTHNQIVRGAEARLDAAAIPNAHFRLLAAAASNDSACADFPSAFASLAQCSVTECAGAIDFLSPYTGGEAAFCQLTLGELREAVSCPFPFSPPLAASLAVAQMCKATSAAAGVPSAGCPPPAPPPPPPPDVPAAPAAPAVGGAAVVTTAAQLRLAIRRTPPSASLSVYLPEGTALRLGGEPLHVEGVELFVSSDGDGALIDAEHLSRVFDVRDGAALHLTRLTLANGFAETAGGALLVGGATVRLHATTIVNASAAVSGGAIYAGASHVHLADGSVIAHCRAERDGGAVLAILSTVSFTGGCVVRDVSCGGLGGAFQVRVSSILLAGGSAVLRTAADWGGVAFSQEGSVVVGGGSVVAHSRARLGGAFLLVWRASFALLDGSALLDAEAAEAGGVAATIDGDIVVSNSTITAASSFRGGAFRLSAGLLHLTNGSAISDCHAEAEGGVAHILAGAFRMDGGATITNASASPADAGSGGALAIGGGSCLVTGGARIAGCSARTGGAVAMKGGSLTLAGGSAVVGSRAAWEGGALFLSGGACVLTEGSALLDSAAAVAGGGAHVTTGGSLRLTRNARIERASASEGGAVLVDGGSLALSDGAAIVGAAAASRGGAIALSNGEVNLTSGAALLNVSAARGGAFRLGNDFSLRLTDATVDGAAATDLGSLLFVASGAVERAQLVVLTHTTIRTRECASLVAVETAAQFVFRNLTIDRLPGCTAAQLALGLAPIVPLSKRCGEAYARHDAAAAAGVCAPYAACADASVVGTPLPALTCECAPPTFADPAVEARLAPSGASSAREESAGLMRLSTLPLALASLLSTRCPPPRAEAAGGPLDSALTAMLPRLMPRLSAVGVDSSRLAACLRELPADRRDEALLAAAVRSPALEHALLALEHSMRDDASYTPPHAALLAALLSSVDPSYGAEPEQTPPLAAAAASLAPLDASLARCTAAMGRRQRAAAAAAFCLLAAAAAQYGVAELALALPQLLAQTSAIIRAKVPADWTEADVEVVACDAVASELLDIQYEDVELIEPAGVTVEDSPLAPTSIASFLGWLRDEVEAEDLEEWRADAKRLYQSGSDDSLPGLDVDVDMPGASTSKSASGTLDDDDDDEWFDDDLM